MENTKTICDGIAAVFDGMQSAGLHFVLVPIAFVVQQVAVQEEIRNVIKNQGNKCGLGWGVKYFLKQFVVTIILLSFLLWQVYVGGMNAKLPVVIFVFYYAFWGYYAASSFSDWLKDVRKTKRNK